MSSQTEESVTQETGADELAKLGIEQLKQLVEENEKQGNTSAATALKAVIEEREKLESKLAEADSAPKEKGPKKSRKGTRVPKGRQVTAAASFNADPDALARLKVVMEGDPNADPPIEPVIQPDGTYKMTPHFVQTGISAYYAERRTEKGSATTAESTAADAPIIPDVAPDGSTPTEAAESNEAPAEASAPDGAGEMDEDKLDVEPQAGMPMPINPYPDENDE